MRGVISWFTRRPAVAMVLLATAAILAITITLGTVRQQEELAEDRIYQLHEVQEALSNLHRDLRMVGVLTGAATEIRGAAIEAYLSARRDDLASVRWLGTVSGDDGRVDTVLTSAETHGFDPHRDTTVAGMLDGLTATDLRAAPPTTYRNAASMALVVPAGNDHRNALVALVAIDTLLAEGLHNLTRTATPLILQLGDAEIGHWPSQPAHRRHNTVMLPAAMGALEFTVAFATPDWLHLLAGLSAVPQIVLLAGLSLAAAIGLARPSLPPQAPPAAVPRRDARATLWRLGELAASLSHDLGQPLNVIRLTAEAAQDGLDHGGSDPARLRRGLSTTVEQVRRTQAMVEALVTACRRPETAPRLLDPVTVIEQALEQVERRVSAQGIDLCWQPQDAVPPVLGHPERLQAALTHLLVNACKAMAANAMGTGAPARLEVSCHRAGNVVDISVADTGPGMPPELRSQLQSADVEAGARGGIGLGLTVAMGVAAEMGGTLTAEDLPAGTRVTLRLPMAGRSVLMAEDDDAAAAELTRFLEERGWVVRVAHGGNPAYRMFIDQPADVVLTDLNMDDGDGWQLISRLRAEAPDLPIVAMSSAEAQDARAAVQAGAAVVLRKPVSPADVANELDAATIYG